MAQANFICITTTSNSSRIKLFHALIFILTTFFIPINSHSKNFDDHAIDIQEILQIDFSNPSGQECLETISKYIIDEHKAFRNELLSKNPKLYQRCIINKKSLYMGYSHRILFHWGAGDIPFRYPPLKDYFEKLKKKGIPDEEIERFKRMLLKEWKRRRNELFKAVEKFLKYSGVNPQKAAFLAKPFATLIYDIHLLSDYQTKHIEGLQPIKYLKNDIIKVLTSSLFRNDPKMEKIVRALKKVDVKDVRKAAKEITKILKKNLPEALESALGKTLGTILVRGAVATGHIAKLIRTYNKMTSKIKNPNIRTATNVGLFTAATSGVFNIYDVHNGEIEITQAISNIAEDTAIASSSMYISEAMIQKIGNGKYAMTVLLDKSASISIKAISAGLNFGLATFIFDETRSIYNLISGDIDLDSFVNESAENTVKGIATGTACYCTVLLYTGSAAGPGGIVLVGVSIGAYILTTKAITVFKEYQEEDYLFIEDIYYLLPFEIQRKETIWNLDHRKTIWNADESQNKTIWSGEQIDRNTIFNTSQKRKSIWGD